jgi:transcription initiation factor TFIID TATA-box-binding protein
MVNRLQQQQNQIYGVQQQPQRLQVIPSAPIQRPVRHIVNSQQIRYIQPGASISTLQNYGSQISQQQPQQSLVQVISTTASRPIRHIMNGQQIRYIQPGARFFAVNGSQISQQQQQQSSHVQVISTGTNRPQRYIMNNQQIRYIQPGARFFAVQNYGSQISQQHQIISTSSTTAAPGGLERQVVNNIVQLHHNPQPGPRVVATEPVAALKQEVLNEVMDPASSYENNTFSASSAVPQDVMTISINNVVCNYSLPMHIDLRKLALNTWNVSYDRSGSLLTKQKRHPGCHVKIYNSGKVYIVGCKSEAASRQAARAVGREIQKIMGKTDQRICLRKFRINNILATCRFPFGILIDQVNRKYPKETYYEPELTVGLIWRMTEPKASIRIHTTGTIVVTGATSEADVSVAVEKIYDYVKDFQCDSSKIAHAAPRKRRTNSVVNEEFANVKRPKHEFEDVFDDETGVNLFEDEADIDDII